MRLTERFKRHEDDDVYAEVRDKVESASRIPYIDYDWALNAPGHFPEFAT